MRNKYIVILSTAEWDNPFWTNKQHVAVAMAKMGYKVFYIDSLGLRKPSTSSQDISRIIKRIKKAVLSPRKVRENIWVWSPILFPFQSFSLVRRFNKIFLTKWLFYWLNKLNFKSEIFWTYSPITTYIVDTKYFEMLVYHCVDEIKAQPGMPVKLLEKGEQELSIKSNIVFTTAKNLYETRKKWNLNTFYYSNVADFYHFQKATDLSVKVPVDIIEIPSPRVGFIGALSGYKVDFDLIEYLAKKNSTYSFVLIGKVGEGDPWTNVSALEMLENVYFMGPKKYDELPAYLKAIDVAILPNKINEYTKSMFPMKFFEYLAASKPVVSVALESLEDYKGIAYISKNYEEFNEYIKLAIKDVNYNLDKRLAVASQFTYDTRMKKMMDIVEKKL